MGLLGDLFDIGADIVSLPFKIAGAAIELGSDIGETVATGDSRTSYTIRDEADKIVEESQRDVDEASRDLWNVWWDVSQEAKTVARTRSEVYGMVKMEIHNDHIMELPSESQLSSGNIYSNTPNIDSTSFNVGTAFGVLGIDDRREAAEEYLRKAKRYRVKADDIISKMHRKEQLLQKISHCQTEEAEALEGVRRSYKTRSEDDLKKNEEILREISILLLREVSEETERAYGELVRKLKNLWG